MNYLTKKQILLIHSIIIDETGGAHGVRDYHAIFSLKHAPKQKVFGKVLYPTIFLKAAVYAHTIISQHPFLDGNKRTAMTAASVFLEENSYTFNAKEGEIEKFVLKIIKDRFEIIAIAQWFGSHSRRKK